ncbi:hypothetical protein N7G274_000216 [Stereocaulon virgatum]|uniref:DUF4211 domain-containing protein n=1 Tax=Stereocaulon virgatum TaxID=373712 RepID=A0ABR4ARI4_9LECA
MSAPRKSTRKKRQTQLSFSPLPSSSPAASQYPDQIQPRAASVRYDNDGSSPVKRRRVENAFSNNVAGPLAKSAIGQKLRLVVESPNNRVGQLPTPAASSQVDAHLVAADSSSDELQILPSSRPKSVASPENGGSKSDISSDEEDVPIQSARRHRLLPIALSSDESNSSEDVVITPVRKRRITPPLRSPAQESNHSLGHDCELDLQDELDDLKSTSDVEICERRTRDAPGNSARNVRQQKLEELKRRRAGLPEGRDEKEDDEEEAEEYDSIVAEVSEPEAIHHAMRRRSNLDEYEEDFVDDDDDTLGVEMDGEDLRRAIPIEFTHHANKKTIEHFKDEVEWMVHNKLNPAFDRYDEIYEVAHRKLDDEFKAYAGSKFISPVWAPEFDAALKSRPVFYRTDIQTMFEHKCDACRRTNHPPKHKVTFTGKPYDRKTLEPIADDDEYSVDSGSKGSSSSEHEESFFLGRKAYQNSSSTISNFADSS